MKQKAPKGRSIRRLVMWWLFERRDALRKDALVRAQWGHRIVRSFWTGEVVKHYVPYDPQPITSMGMWTDCGAKNKTVDTNRVLPTSPHNDKPSGRSETN